MGKGQSNGNSKGNTGVSPLRFGRDDVVWRGARDHGGYGRSGGEGSSDGMELELAFAPLEFGAEDVEEAVGVEAEQVDCTAGLATEDAVVEDELDGLLAIDG